MSELSSHWSNEPHSCITCVFDRPLVRCVPFIHALAHVCYECVYVCIMHVVCVCSLFHAYERCTSCTHGFRQPSCHPSTSTKCSLIRKDLTVSRKEFLLDSKSTRQKLTAPFVSSNTSIHIDSLPRKMSQNRRSILIIHWSI